VIASRWQADENGASASLSLSLLPAAYSEYASVVVSVAAAHLHRFDRPARLVGRRLAAPLEDVEAAVAVDQIHEAAVVDPDVVGDRALAAGRGRRLVDLLLA